MLFVPVKLKCADVGDVKSFPNKLARTAQHSTAQHSTAQHSTAQHSTAQHSTAQHSTQSLPAWSCATVATINLRQTVAVAQRRDLTLNQCSSSKPYL